jgi:hypothetical protein
MFYKIGPLTAPLSSAPLTLATLEATLALMWSCASFHKTFTHVTYGQRKISWTVHFIHSTIQFYQNVLTYFVLAISQVMYIKCLCSRHLRPML